LSDTRLGPEKVTPSSVKNAGKKQAGWLRCNPKEKDHRGERKRTGDRRPQKEKKHCKDRQGKKLD